MFLAKLTIEDELELRMHEKADIIFQWIDNVNVVGFVTPAPTFSETLPAIYLTFRGRDFMVVTKYSDQTYNVSPYTGTVHNISKQKFEIMKKNPETAEFDVVRSKSRNWPKS